MKRIILLLIALSLCICLSACGAKTNNSDYDYILSLLDRGEYDMAISVIEMLRDAEENSIAPENDEAITDGISSEVSPTGQTEYLFENQKPIKNGSDLHFIMQLENKTDLALTLSSLEITDYDDNGNHGEPYYLSGEEFSGNDFYRIEPGEVAEHWDGHPIPTLFSRRDYVIKYNDDNGVEYSYTFLYDTSEYADMQDAGASGAYSEPDPVDFGAEGEQDLETLRINASFSAEVARDVFWVPAVVLGGSRYSNEDILAMVDWTPEEKQAAVSTLYEALQLFQIGRFSRADDNVFASENGLNWEFHKPGYYAVQTNCGCCASDSDWLHYILEGDYDEVGYISYSMPDGSGHVFNYIKQGPWYYIIDLTHYINDGMLLPPAIEDGDTNKYRESDYVLGNIHRTPDLTSFADYLLKSFNDPPVLITKETADDVPAVATKMEADGRVQVIYAEMNGLDVEVLYDAPNDNLTFSTQPAPSSAITPKWN